MVLWIGYFIGEVLHAGLDKEMLIPIIIGIVLGTILGIAVGLRTHNRIIGIYEGIILEIENPDAAHSSNSKND